MVSVTGNQGTAGSDNPDIRRRGFGYSTVLINEPSVACAPLERRLPRQHVRQQSDGLDVNSAPSIIRNADHGNSLCSEGLITGFIEAAHGHDQACRHHLRWKGMLATRHPAGDLQINDAVTDAI